VRDSEANADLSRERSLATSWFREDPAAPALEVEHPYSAISRKY
jgi:hypothetical protein